MTFVNKHTNNGVRIVLPSLPPRPVSHQIPKRPPPYVIPTRRPQTVGLVPILTPLDRLKAIRKIRKLQNKTF